jgi:hypothetical protein
MAFGRPLALTFTVLFGLMALVSSVTVGRHTSPAPLLLVVVVVVVVAGAVTVYVLTYVPRLERRDAEDLAPRRAARAAARAARARSPAAKAPHDEVTGTFGPPGGSGGSLPRANGQGPGDEVTGAFWPPGGSGGSLPRANTGP